MRRPKTLNRPSVQLPSGTIEVTADLVPAIRRLLRGGLSEDFLRSCVRIGAFAPFGGGRKADLVGGLRIDVHAVLKLGNRELDRHVALMRYINALRPKTFPSVLLVDHLSGGRVFIVMENLRGHVTVLDKIYREETSAREVAHIMGKVFESLRLLHGITPDRAPTLSGLPHTPEPFAGRLAAKLDVIFRSDPDLAAVMEHAGVVMGQPCPPVKELLMKARSLATTHSSDVPLRLAHGDIHFGNIMVRRSGKTAYRVRLLDPNPEVGFSQPLYDIGKLLHWAEPVGWTQVAPTVCRVEWRSQGRSAGWTLDARTRRVSAAAEKRRTWAEAAVRHFGEELRSSYGADFEPMLALATASAHVGLAAVLVGDENRAPRRFVFAYALKHLATFS